MSRYSEIRALLTNQPIPKKQVTIGASVRLPVQLLAEVTAMANRANVSRNEMMSKLLASAVQASFDLLVETGDTDVIAEVQHDADGLAAMYWENIEVEEHDEHDEQE
jgi:hypothetical protein